MDGVVNTLDAVLVLKSYAKVMLGQPTPLTPEQFALADVDADGACTTNDAVLILRHYAMNMIGKITWDELLSRS